MNANGQPRLKLYSLHDLPEMPQLRALPPDFRRAMAVVAHVLPFRTNNYVVDELIDWGRVPHDPIFQLTFPQPGMLHPGHFRQMADVLQRGAPEAEVRAVADRIRHELNPHPAGQLAHNTPVLDDEPVRGLQHKYPQTCLVFPPAGQTCHAYCTYCFRWAQFVGTKGLKIANDDAGRLHEYLRRHGEITDLLFTGGDPLVMTTAALAAYLEPLLAPEFDHVQTIRIGTKALGYWPYRFLAGGGDELMRLFERVVRAGKHLAVMAHVTHWRELVPQAPREAIRRLRDAGAVVRTQAPLVRHVNDTPAVWGRLWNDQVRLGCVPYYMFVERDTGASRYFKVPLARALDVYRESVAQNSGLGRTARGPVMSTLPGKVVVDGVARVGGRPVFVLSFLQARRAAWCKRPFFAEFDPAACWLTDLRPADGAGEFFFEAELRNILSGRSAAASGERHSPARADVPRLTLPLPVAGGSWGGGVHGVA